MENLFFNLLAINFENAFNFAYIFKSIITRWYLYLALLGVIIGVVLFAVLKRQPKRNSLSKTQKLAYISVFSALLVTVNILQIPTPLAQLSLVATVACIAGILLGPVSGFAVAFVGDLIAGIIAPLGVYSPIIGIATSLFGLVPGIVFAYFKGNDLVKLIVSFVITFILSSVILNTIGLSLIYPKVYVLTDRLLMLPVTLLFHAINCALSYLIIRTFKKTLKRSKFYIDHTK